MQNWRDTLISSNGKIEDAVRKIETNDVKICLVVDSDNTLIGTVTDGDIRRAILKYLSADSPITDIMETNPTVGSLEDSKIKSQELMNDKNIYHLPLLDEDHKIAGLALHPLLRVSQSSIDNWVILMAGGLGRRLAPMTDSTPKPLLKVGNKPLLETILGTFIDQGFHKFYISVNYRSEMIKDYFGDGSDRGIQIRYLEENEQLGTAGALGLIEDLPQETLITMNGDLLTKVNFHNLLEFHRDQGSVGTMGVREFDLQVPYGVVNIEKGRISHIEEKPVHSFFVNAGIYALEPQILKLIEPGTPIDMTELFLKAIEKELNTGVFPIREYWMDIGKIDDFHQANGDFTDLFE